MQAALEAAINQIRVTLTTVAARVTEGLGLSSQSAGRIAERDLLISTQFELRRNAPSLHRAFALQMKERVVQDMTPREDSKRKLAAADWQSLTLVDDNEMEERMYSDRIGQQISHVCEAELRELAAYMGSLLMLGSADQDRNPLRPEILGAALYLAIETVLSEADARKLLARELGGAFAKAMPECYQQIVRELQGRGVQPIVLSVRQFDGPGNQLPGVNSAYESISGLRSRHGDYDAPTSRSGFEHSEHGQRYSRSPSGSAGGAGVGGGSTRGNGGGSDQGGGYGNSYNGPAYGSPMPPSGGGSSRFGTAPSRSGLTASQADAQLMALLRHLTAVASRPGELERPLRGSTGAGRLADSHASTGGSMDSRHLGGDRPGAPSLPLAQEGLTGMMAVNLIRAHRDELLQASGGRLDHMVIDVVGSLFDQILSDSRVPPQMARQIARLQLPVLRVALNDPTFFSSRRHPVRRFVNRIGSLACAFDDFDDGPGKLFLDRVRELVQEIVDGDFDQIDIYASKLGALESFIADQTHEHVEQKGAVGTLGDKENELRLQQRYMLQLHGSLQPMALPDYLRDFLSQVWSQALVLAVSRDGADSDRAKRYRRVGRDVVMSIQAKGSPALRKKFLMQLPPLMKDLNEGLGLIAWPEAAQRAFFSKLLPAHADSLKGQAQSELDHNMMVKQLEAIFNTPVPGIETLSSADPVPDVDAEQIAKRFSAEEAKQIGLVSESAVDWSGEIDIDLGAETDGSGDTESGTDTGSDTGNSTSTGDSAAVALAGIDVDLSLGHADPAEPTRGPQLIDHIKLGFAYQMHLKDEWQKVRLAHVSAGRGFFVFTRGKKHQETISMTARMLARMCETNRLRAVESSYLMERATHRARKQLAALGTPTRGQGLRTV